MAKKFDFNFDVSGLPEYAKENANEIILEIVAEGDTAERTGISIRPNISSSEKIHILSGDITLQANTGCEFTPSGSTVISNRTLEVIPMKYQESFDPKKFNDIYLAQNKRTGEGGELVIPIEQALRQHIVEGIKAKKEKLMWVGNTAGSPADLMDGFVTKIGAEATRIDITAGSPSLYNAPYTTSNIIAMVDAMIAAVPEEVSATRTIYINMSHKNFNTLISALASTSNYLQQAVDYDGKGEFVYPLRSNVIIKSVVGLATYDYVIATFNENLLIGFDATNDEVIFYQDPRTKCWDVSVFFKLGVNVAFPQWIVTNF